jgi:flagellar biosynthesis protein FlhG
MHQDILTDGREEKPALFTVPKERKTIWAVGGGKGGTGKSFISSSLGILLASEQGDVTMIDADLGGPNLHTLLAVREADRDIGDFVSGKIPSLRETAIPTPIAGLKLVKGSENFLFMANLNHLKKLKLIRQIKSLETRTIIIDVGTGSSFNTLDFFLLANPGILVVTPEPTSIENAYHFLKSCIVRVLKLYMEFYKMQDLVRHIAEHMENNSNSIRSFVNAIVSHDAGSAHLLYKALKVFRPALVMNKARDERDVLLGRSIADVVRKYLVVELDYAGAVPEDERVHACVKNFKPYLREYPDSPVSRSIREIAGRLKSRSSLY